MKTVLFGWNPDDPRTWRDHDRVFTEWRAKGEASGHWNSRSGRIRAGDRFVLVRQGGPNRANRRVISVGRITSDPVRIPHWVPEKAAKGVRTNRVEVLHVAMWADPILTLDELESAQPDVRNWSPISGGETLLRDAAQWLFTTLDVDC